MQCRACACDVAEVRVYVCVLEANHSLCTHVVEVTGQQGRHGLARCRGSTLLKPFQTLLFVQEHAWRWEMLKERQPMLMSLPPLHPRVSPLAMSARYASPLCYTLHGLMCST